MANGTKTLNKVKQRILDRMAKRAQLGAAGESMRGKHGGCFIGVAVMDGHMDGANGAQGNITKAGYKALGFEPGEIEQAMDFMGEFVSIHDARAHEDDAEQRNDWDEKLRNLADEHGLKYPSDEKIALTKEAPVDNTLHPDFDWDDESTWNAGCEWEQVEGVDRMSVVGTNGAVRHVDYKYGVATKYNTDSLEDSLHTVTGQQPLDDIAKR
tara:strand:+ start:2172 stop:2804 length:633 start_codon:yes stop_codon:yes gene_type:complete